MKVKKKWGVYNPINLTTPTEQDWLTWKNCCLSACKHYGIPLSNKDDCMGFLMTVFDMVWKYWDHKKIPWVAFANFCAKRKILDFLRIQNRQERLRGKKKYHWQQSRFVSLTEFQSLDTGEPAVFTDRRMREPVDIVADNEILKILMDKLPPRQQEELIRWYHGECMENKQQDNLRNNIKITAKKIFEELDWLFHKRKQRHKDHGHYKYIPLHLMPGYLGERMLHNKWLYMDDEGNPQKYNNPVWLWKGKRKCRSRKKSCKDSKKKISQSS